jgi:hypothetical protein
MNGKIWKWKKSKKDQLIINSHVMNGKNWKFEKRKKRKKRQWVERFEPWPSQIEQGDLPLSYQSICDLYVCVAYLFNEFSSFNLTCTKKWGPDESRTHHLRVRICMRHHWATHCFVSLDNIVIYYSIFLDRNKTCHQKKGVEPRKGGLNPRTPG